MIEAIGGSDETACVIAEGHQSEPVAGPFRYERDGKENRFTVRYLAVYAKSGADWRMIAWQSTKQD